MTFNLYIVILSILIKYMYITWIIIIFNIDIPNRYHGQYVHDIMSLYTAHASRESDVDILDLDLEILI